MRKYDIDGTPLKLNIKLSDACPKCGRKGFLELLHIATVRCLICGEHIQRWVKA